MIRHCVMLQLRADADTAQLQQIMQGLGSLVDALEGCGGFVHGPNQDFETLSPDFAYGFTLDAVDEAALAGYAEDPRHKALGARLVDLCEAQGIMVFDLEAPA